MTIINEPHQSELINLLGYFQSQRYDDAEQLAIQLSERFPNHPFSWKVIGALLNRTNRLSEALNACQKSVLLEPNNAEAHNNLANTFHKIGKFEAAESSCRQAIEIEPNYAEAYNNLGNILRDLYRFEEALISFKEAISLKSNYAEAYNNLANTFHKIGKFEAAESSYRKAISFDINYAEAYNNLGVLLKELGRHAEADKCYRDALKIKSDLKVALLNLGQLLFDKGQFEEALTKFDLCNNSNAKARALSCLYALGKINEIYQRIETESKFKDENLRIAAMAAFLEETEQKETANNFCKKPLDFIHFSNISDHIDDSNLFISELIKELNDVKSVWEPYKQSTIKGYQSQINIFENSTGKIDYLKSIIIQEIDGYYSKFKKKSCSFIQNWPLQKKLTGWHVILKQHGSQEAHIHPSGWMSGVIYLKVVPALEKNEGAIEFSLNGKRYFKKNASKLTFQPKIGDIVFFPSYLYHKTIPFTSNEERIIVSFDLKPKAIKKT